MHPSIRVSNRVYLLLHFFKITGQMVHFLKQSIAFDTRFWRKNFQPFHFISCFFRLNKEKEKRKKKKEKERKGKKRGRGAGGEGGGQGREALRWLQKKRKSMGGKLDNRTLTHIPFAFFHKVAIVLCITNTHTNSQFPVKVSFLLSHYLNFNPKPSSDELYFIYQVFEEQMQQKNTKWEARSDCSGDHDGL